MTEVNDSSTDQESEVDTLLHTEFGLPLKEAREKAGLSIAEAAQSLLIPEDIVSAIENSQIEKLPGATFVVGYIRSYARILNVSADDVIESYNKILPVGDQIPSTPFVPAEQKDAGNKTAVIMIVSIILLLIIAWWFQADTVTDTKKTYVHENTVDKKDLAVVSHEEEEVTSADSPELMIVNEVDSENDTIETLRKSEEESSFVVDDNPENKKDEIVLMALGESWCEIFDASGERLFYQLIKAGDEQRLYGKAPFKVFLGNASKIRIETNNKTVDFAHLIVGDKKVANFVISADSEASSSNR